MSFLNPVNEPVLRFSSTDADAPQIDYDSRTAGDVKAVLKACLVDGYGTTASAGWTVVNEVDHVAEFVSPSAAMSDYRLGIDDSGTNNTIWYYQFQNTRQNPTNNSPRKNLSYATKTHASNGWQLLITERGILFIELVWHSAVDKLSARITYWGQIKSAIPVTNGKNIMFFNIGHNASISQPSSFYSSDIDIELDSFTEAKTSTAATNALSGSTLQADISVLDLIGAVYLTTDSQDMLIGELPPMLSRVVNKTSDFYGVTESVLDGRNVLNVEAGYSNPLPNAYKYNRSFSIPTDFWEY